MAQPTRRGTTQARASAAAMALGLAALSWATLPNHALAHGGYGELIAFVLAFMAFVSLEGVLVLVNLVLIALSLRAAASDRVRKVCRGFGWYHVVIGVALVLGWIYMQTVPYSADAWMLIAGAAAAFALGAGSLRAGRRTSSSGA